MCSLKSIEVKRAGVGGFLQGENPNSPTYFWTAFSYVDF